MFARKMMVISLTLAISFAFVSGCFGGTLAVLKPAFDGQCNGGGTGTNDWFAYGDWGGSASSGLVWTDIGSYMAGHVWASNAVYKSWKSTYTGRTEVIVTFTVNGDDQLATGIFGWASIKSYVYAASSVTSPAQTVFRDQSLSISLGYNGLYKKTMQNNATYTVRLYPSVTKNKYITFSAGLRADGSSFGYGWMDASYDVLVRSIAINTY